MSDIIALENSVMAGAVSPEIPSVLNADYPACMMWFRFLEGAGASLADKIGNVTDLAITENGAGDGWASWGGPGDQWSSEDAGGAEVYARTTGQAPTAIRTIGAKSMIIELDINVIGGQNGAVMPVGLYSSPSTLGYSIYWSDSGVFQMRLGGESNNSIIVSFTNTPAITRNNRTHHVFAYDRSATDLIGSVDYFANGALVETKIPGTDPGLLNVTTANNNGRLGLGSDVNGTQPVCEVDFYNVRIWVLDSIPTNIASIAAQMSGMRNEFPPLMAGIV